MYAEAHPDQSFGALLYTTFLLSGWAEAKRWMDFEKPGSQADGSFLGITGGWRRRRRGREGPQQGRQKREKGLGRTWRERQRS